MKFKIAAIQESFKGSKRANIESSLESIANAAKNGADLIALQELHTSEYFCQIEHPKFFSYAREFDNEIRIFSQAAKTHKIVLITSLFEERAKGLYHNTAVVFDKDGSIKGKFRKMHIPDDPGFYEKFYFTPGDNEFCPIETSLGKIGILICWDQWYPEAARLMALNGAEILIYPTAIGFDLNDNSDEQARQLNAWLTIQKSHAIANGVFVCAINRVGLEKMENNAINFWGNSFICGPQGEELARGSENCDEILYANIDLNKIYAVRNMWPFFRDRRIEFYKNLDRRFLS